MEKSRKNLWICLAVLLAVLIAAGIYQVKGPGFGKKSTKERVYDFSTNIVKQDLRDSPVSFPEYEESYVLDLGNDSYQVEVHVDTRNRYGMEKEYIYDVCVSASNQEYILVSCSRRV